ncbi:MAG: hypothetical protein Q8Q73_07390 [Stagnimonas sp.]|nr:hypothetical protein [Stagnimonas sp.]
MTLKKAIFPFFFLEEDEVALSASLAGVLPSLRFLDDNRWESDAPVWRDTIEDCRSRFVFLWDSAKLTHLPTAMVSGKLQGPSSGVVIQFMRSKVVDGALLSGQMGVSYSEPWVGTFWRTVLREAKRLSAAKLQTECSDASVIATYLVGDGARRFGLAGGRLRHVTAETYYRVV